MKKQSLILLVPLVLLIVVSIFTVLITVQKKTEQNPTEAVRTFSELTDLDVFQTVPLLVTKNAYYGEFVDCGKRNYVVDINETTMNDYQSYGQLLSKNGFKKHSDNGEEGINKNVFTASYTKEEIVVTVTYMEKVNKTYIIAGENQVLSERLIYDQSYEANNKKDAKTTLHMMELYTLGNSFVFQLKNGHFIINDGGCKEDLPYLLDYLDKLAPEGTKPVVEAWVISHAHGDHMGAINVFLTNPEYAERLYVEEVYFNAPSNVILTTEGGSTGATNAMQTEYATKSLKNQNGETTKLIRPITGQRYYFSDITMEVVFSQEFLQLEDYSSDLNDSSTWLMYNIDGQKALLGGDGDYGGMRAIMRSYDKDYFKLDVFTNLHHGINVYDSFTDFCDITTVLVPFYETYGLWPNTIGGGARLLGERVALENQHLYESVEEFITGGGGIKILTFPYQVGEYQDLGPTKWIYNNGERGVGFPEKANTYK